jgi:drug/metabolite transporter (DMT)-like permease
MKHTSNRNNIIQFPAAAKEPQLLNTAPANKATSSTYLNIILLLALGLVWGSGYAIARFAMTHDVPPLGYAFWQSLGPAVLTCLFVIREGHILPQAKYWRYYLVCGVIGITIPNTAMYFAAPHVPAGLLAVIVNTVPIFIFPLALLCRQELFSWKRCAAVFAGIVGIMLLVIPHTSMAHVSHASYWLLLALLSPLCFAGCAIYVAQQRKQPVSPLSAAAGMLIASTILLTPIVAMSHSFYALTMPFNTAQWVIILEILLSSIGYVLFFHLIKRAGSVYYSMVGGVVGITGLLWGWIIFAEVPSAIMWVAVACILLAIAGLSIFPTRTKK